LQEPLGSGKTPQEELRIKELEEQEKNKKLGGANAVYRAGAAQQIRVEKPIIPNDEMEEEND